MNYALVSFLVCFHQESQFINKKDCIIIISLLPKTKCPKNSILARIFGLQQGYKDKSCPGQDFRETRTEYHPCNCIPLYDQDAQGRQQHQVFINVE